MDRPLIYPVEVPAVEDLLWGWQRSMVAIAKLASAILGPGNYAGSWIDDFAVTPIGGLSVDVNPGQIFSLQPIDPSGYSVLSADSNLILRQYINNQYTQFTLTAPPTAGTSQYYLIQLTPETIDQGDQILQYFDVANPAVAFGGPNNNGQAQSTERVDTVSVQLIAGTPAVTGTEVPPPLTGSAVGGWYILLNAGQTTITSSDMMAVNPFQLLTLKLPYAAGVNLTNTFTQPQYMDQGLVVTGQISAIGGAINANDGLFVDNGLTVNYGNLIVGLGNATISGTLSVETGGTGIGGVTTGYNTSGLTIGWNFTNAYGETDLLLGPGASSTGGLNIYQLNSSGAMVSTTPIFALSSTGGLTLQGALNVTGTTTLNATTVPNAIASENPVPLGQLNSLIPVLFSSLNDVTG